MGVRYQLSSDRILSFSHSFEIEGEKKSNTSLYSWGPLKTYIHYHFDVAVPDVKTITQTGAKKLEQKRGQSSEDFVRRSLHHEPKPSRFDKGNKTLHTGLARVLFSVCAQCVQCFNRDSISLLLIALG